MPKQGLSFFDMFDMFDNIVVIEGEPCPRSKKVRKGFHDIIEAGSVECQERLCFSHVDKMIVHCE